MARWRSRILLGAGAALVGGWFWRRTHPEACPYGARFVLKIPRPLIGPRRLREILEPVRGERILEIGPGIGIYTVHLAEWTGPDGTVAIFDIQQEFLDHAKRAAAERGLDNVEPTQGSAESLPYDDDSCDAVVLITVLGEIPDQAAALNEITRVLKPGGRLIAGEALPDPDFVSAARLQRMVGDAGLRFERLLGPPVMYFARFGKPDKS